MLCIINFTRKFKLRNTHYDNPHGLMNYKNYSTAYDQGTLCLNVINNPIFKQVVKTISHTC